MRSRTSHREAFGQTAGEVDEPEIHARLSAPKALLIHESRDNDERITITDWHASTSPRNRFSSGIHSCQNLIPHADRCRTSNEEWLPTHATSSTTSHGPQREFTLLDFDYYATAENQL